MSFTSFVLPFASLESVLTISLTPRWGSPEFMLLMVILSALSPLTSLEPVPLGVPGVPADHGHPVRPLATDIPGVGVDHLCHLAPPLAGVLGVAVDRTCGLLAYLPDADPGTLTQVCGVDPGALVPVRGGDRGTLVQVRGAVPFPAVKVLLHAHSILLVETLPDATVFLPEEVLPAAVRLLLIEIEIVVPAGHPFVYSSSGLLLTEADQMSPSCTVHFVSLYVTCFQPREFFSIN